MDSNDISAALNKLLSDPTALANAMSIAGSLMGNLPSSEAPPAAEATPKTEDKETYEDSKEHIAESATQSDATASLNSLAALAPLLSGTKKNDPRCALLYALKPYMGHGRGDKIDTLVNLLKIADIAGGLLGGKIL